MMTVMIKVDYVRWGEHFKQRFAELSNQYLYGNQVNLVNYRNQVLPHDTVDSQAVE